MIKKSFFIIFLLFIIPFTSAENRQTDFIKTDEVVVIFEEPLELAAKEVASVYSKLNSELEETTKWKLDYAPTVILIKENKTFQRIAGNSHIVAFANPQKKLIVIDYSKMNRYPFSLGTTLKHEICHLLLNNHIKRENLPRWFDEGIAQWLSDGISELIADKKKSMLTRAVLSGNILSLDSLEYRFPKDKNALFLAYEESKSIVEYMGKEFGENRMLFLLRHLKNGDEFDAAILESFSLSFNELEAKWLASIKKRTTWYTYFSIHVYEILFFLGAMTTVYGFIRLVIKKRNYKDEDEEYDEDEDEECEDEDYDEHEDYEDKEECQ
ncbi:MAG: hypothetical protein GY749_38900 [Desulfobacteraceae bacterium]|nr:hypothetical protein [Desulfobacteraceae bacterium]